ncbi:MAG: DEAD/DEAH box helicase family protein, partial [Fusobacteriaceae bacterium]
MNKLINNDSFDMNSILKNSIPKCKEFYFIVSFIRFSGVQMLLDTLKKAEEFGITGKIITTNYMGVTEKKAIETLLKFKNIEIKFFDAEFQGFHPKGYIFDFSDYGEIIIGSANLTRGGLRSNIEWSSCQKIEKNSRYWNEILDEFDYIWKKSKNYSPEKFPERDNNVVFENEIPSEKEILPNYMQKIGLSNLDRLRQNGGKRALGIATTGTGKTYLAAFDVKNFNPEKALFIVHREEILIEAEKSFKRVIPNKKMGRYSGNLKNLNCDYLFATVQS